MNTNKWVIVGLVGCVLLVFGYLVYMNQQVDDHSNSAPASVAAIRGGVQTPANSPISSPSAMAVDYAQSLKNDLDLANKNVAKYEAATRAHMGEARKDPSQGAQ